MSAHIRLATKHDVPVIHSLNKQALSLYKWKDLDFIRRTVSRGHYYVLCCDDKIVGAMKFYLEKRVLWIGAIAIFKKYRGKGYADRLMKFAERRAQYYGYDKVRVDFLASTGVGSFYKRMGYTLNNTYDHEKYHIYQRILLD